MAQKKDNAIQLIHVSDIHFGSGESHGRINPDTGLNVRFEDFVAALKKVVDYAINQNADVFLFSGDAYRNASPEPVYQKMFATELRRLSEANIQIVLLVGNHDQILRSSSSHSMSVFQSLAVPNLVTIDTPQFITLDTANGALQIIGLPHVTRNVLMTHNQYSELPIGDIDKVVVSHVRDLMQEMYERLDPTMPCVVTAHAMVDRARAGAEQELMIGYTMTFPTDLFIDNRVDYVALGHVHGFQVLRDKAPTIAYAGSVERVDFGEEGEDKGFVHASIKRGEVEIEFHSIGPRPFVTVDADLTEEEKPTEALCNAIQKKISDGCVLRLRYKLKQEQIAQIDETKIRETAKSALSLQLRPDAVSVQREVRMPEITESSVQTPLNALETYLEQIAPERKDKLLQRARELCQRLKENDN